MIIWLVKTKAGERKFRLMRNIFNANDWKCCGKCAVYSWMLNQFLKWSFILWHDIFSCLLFNLGVRVRCTCTSQLKMKNATPSKRFFCFSTKNSTVDLLLCAACCVLLTAGCCAVDIQQQYTVDSQVAAELHCISVFLSSNLVSNLKWPYLPVDNYIIWTYIGGEILADCNQKLHKLPSVALNCFGRFLFST